MTLNLQPSIYTRQKGFTLLEALIAFLLLSIIVLGSGTILNWMLMSQNQTYINSILVSEMQKRLQNAQPPTTTPTAINLTGDTAVPCNVTLTNFDIAGKTYYMDCKIRALTMTGTTILINWPVMAASPNTPAEATDCVKAVIDGTTPTPDCYIVGN